MAGDVDQVVKRVVAELQEKADLLSSYENGKGRYRIWEKDGELVVCTNPVHDGQKPAPLAYGDAVQIDRWLQADKVKRDGYNRMLETDPSERKRIKKETAETLAELKAEWTIKDGGTLRPEARPDPFAARSERSKKEPRVGREPRAPRERPEPAASNGLRM